MLAFVVNHFTLETCGCEIMSNLAMSSYRLRFLCLYFVDSFTRSNLIMLSLWDQC